MADTLKQAIEKMATLPESTRQRIGDELLLHIEKLHRLRSKIESAARSLDRTGGQELKMSEVIQRARARYDQP